MLQSFWHAHPMFEFITDVELIIDAKIVDKIDSIEMNILDSSRFLIDPKK